MAWGQPKAKSEEPEAVAKLPPATALVPVTGDLEKPKKSSLIEFSSEALAQDPNEGLDFGDSPVHCVCPHCERSVITFLDHEASWVTWLLASIVWFSLGWMALWVLPLLWPAFKDVVHHCPRCLNVIARQTRIKLPTFKSEVMTVKIGSCAVVLARKYVMIAGGLITVIIVVCVLRSQVSLIAQAPGDMIPKGPPSQRTWENFIQHCGPRQSMKHRSSVARAFEEKFRRRTFKWQGEVLLIREGFDVFLLKTKSVVMVRMYPQRFPRREIPDVALLFGEDRNKEVSDLVVGDWIEFEATMTSHGSRGDPEVMMMWHVGVAQKPHPLSSTPTKESIEAGKREVGKSEQAAEMSDAEANESPADVAVSDSRLVLKLQNATDASATTEAALSALASATAPQSDGPGVKRGEGTAQHNAEVSSLPAGSTPRNETVRTIPPIA